jgi:hypothetical protein
MVIDFFPALLTSTQRKGERNETRKVLGFIGHLLGGPNRGHGSVLHAYRKMRCNSDWRLLEVESWGDKSFALGERF